MDGEFRIGLFALKDIAPGTELTYDYRFESFGPLQKCLCNSKNCRGFIGLNKKEDDPLYTVKSKKSKPVLIKKKRKDSLNDEGDKEDEVIVGRNSMVGPKILQAALQKARTSFARGSFLIRNMKLRLAYFKNQLPVLKTRKSLGEIIEDLYLDQTDSISLSTFILTCKGSFHFASQCREPIPVNRNLNRTLLRNFNPCQRHYTRQSLESIIQRLQK